MVSNLNVDNTIAMVGKRNSIGFRFLEKSPVFIGSCPCHPAHIAASNANDALIKCIGLNFEDVCVDCYYWFDKSTNVKGSCWNILTFVTRNIKLF